MAAPDPGREIREDGLIVLESKMVGSAGLEPAIKPNFKNLAGIGQSPFMSRPSFLVLTLAT